MAELLNKIPTNLTEYPNSFKRQGAFPLEAYSVFYSKADADAYAATNAVSYVGQTLAVVKANAEDPTKVDDVTLYIIADAAGTLQEVGKAPDIEINLDDYATTSAVTEAIEAEKTRAEAAEEALGARIDAIDFVDSSELANAVKDFATTAYVDGEIDKIEETIASLNHFKAEVVTSIDDITELGILYLIKDDSANGIDKYNEYIVVDGEPVLIGDTTTDLSNYYTKTEVDTEIGIAESNLTSAYKLYFEEALDNLGLLTLSDDFSTFKTDNTTAIATAKQEAIDAAKVAEEAKGYAVAETVASIYATKDDLAPVRAAASNAETSVNNLTERFDEIVAVGGEPNAINNIKVNGNTLSISDKTVDISVPIQITDLTDGQIVLDDIAAAKANAAQGISNAAAVAADLSSLTSTVTGQGGTIAELTTDLANKANASDVYTKDETIAAITSSVNAKAEEIDATVAAINAKIADVYTKTEADNLFLNQDQVDARISTLIDAANNEDTITNVNDLVNYVNKNASDLAALITNVNKNSAAIADIIQPKASEEISVAEDGTLGINKISTDKLVQGDKTLVLSGGTATV
jgi:hypothetical protein